MDYTEIAPLVPTLLDNLSDSLIEKSELNCLIPAEIKNDDFYACIQKLAQIEDIATILEIGSSSGAGSTEAFVTGMRNNPNHPSYSV